MKVTKEEMLAVVADWSNTLHSSYYEPRRRKVTNPKIIRELQVLKAIKKVIISK